MKTGRTGEQFMAVMSVTPPSGRPKEEKKGPFDSEREADKAIDTRIQEGRSRGEMVFGHIEPA